METMEKKEIKSLTLAELKAEMEQLGEKPFRAVQLYEWMHVKLARSFDEMTYESKMWGKIYVYGPEDGGGAGIRHRRHEKISVCPV